MTLAEISKASQARRQELDLCFQSNLGRATDLFSSRCVKTILDAFSQERTKVISDSAFPYKFDQNLSIAFSYEADLSTQKARVKLIELFKQMFPEHTEIAPFNIWIDEIGKKTLKNNDFDIKYYSEKFKQFFISTNKKIKSRFPKTFPDNAAPLKTSFTSRIHSGCHLKIECQLSLKAEKERTRDRWRQSLSQNKPKIVEAIAQSLIKTLTRKLINCSLHPLALSPTDERHYFIYHHFSSARRVLKKILSPEDRHPPLSEWIDQDPISKSIRFEDIERKFFNPIFFELFYHSLNSMLKAKNTSELKLTGFSIRHYTYIRYSARVPPN